MIFKNLSTPNRSLVKSIKTVSTNLLSCAVAVEPRFIATCIAQFIQPYINKNSWSRKDYTVLMALFLLNYMKFRSGLNISPLNRNLCVLLYLFFAADDKRFTSLNGLRLHINTVHLPKHLRCVECEYATNSATHLQRHAKRQHDIAKLDVKRWKHEQ